MSNQGLTLVAFLAMIVVGGIVYLITGIPESEQFTVPAEEPKQVSWPWDGLTGGYDHAALRRGLQVYREICAGCHSLNRVAFRTLEDIGLSGDRVKDIAAEYSFPGDPDEYGDPTERSGIPADYFPAPFANEQAARMANNGALPPDLSLIVKARPGGADYVYSLLSGFEDAPDDFDLDSMMNYNPYFAGRQIAMAQPLYEGMVEYADGTEATVDQMARDITSFLTWAAEPSLDERHELGFKVLVFLGIWLIIMFFSNRKVWAVLKRADKS